MQAAKNLRNAAPGPTGDLKTRVHAYPQELVSFILDHQKDPLFMDGLRANGSAPPAPLPERAVLEQVISVCYQASLLREEERAIEFRLIICDPEILPAQEGPPTGLQPLTFAQTRPFNEFELHRLTPAVDFSRMLVAISIDPQNGPQIWGIINSGNRWLQEVLGGRKTCPPLPACPLIYVTGPGQISVSLGPKVIASLNGGQINYPTQDVFAARWLSESFASVRTEMRETARRGEGQVEEALGQVRPAVRQNGRPASGAAHYQRHPQFPPWRACWSTCRRRWPLSSRAPKPLPQHQVPIPRG